MTKTLILGVGLSACMIMGATAAPASRSDPAAHASAAPRAAIARPWRAVLRYDAATTSACRSFSDQSSEICLLLALHVIDMAGKPLPRGAL